MPQRNAREENPRRLTTLLQQIRKNIFHETQAEMANRLNEVCRKDTTGKPLIRFSHSLIANLENGQTSVRYFHLHAYGDALNIPTGLLLLVSKYSFLDGDHGPESLKNIAQVLRALIDMTEAAAETGRPLSTNELVALRDVCDGLHPRSDEM